MSMIEVTSDVKNTLLARREITCTFKGLAGKMKKPEAVDMISKQFKLDGKVVVPIMLKNETGRPMVTGTFYIYDDEKLARAHLKPAIFSRLDKAKGGSEKEGEAAPAEKPEEKKEAKESKEPKEVKEVKEPKDTKEPEKKVKEPKEAKKEEKKADEKPKEKEEAK